MDVRLSQEQPALRDAAAQVVDRIGPTAVAQIGEPERGAKLHAAVTRIRVAGTARRRPRAVARWHRAWKRPSSPKSSAGEPADVSFLGPTLAAELRRLAGAPPSSSVETVALDARLSSLVRGVDGEWPAAVAIDTQGSSRALVLTPDGEGSRLAQVELRAAPSGLDLTRPSEVLDPCARGHDGRGCRSGPDGG